MTRQIKAKKKLRRSEAGFTILETMIAAFILTAGIIASYSVLTQTMVAVSVISSRLTASYLAQEGMEIVRNIRESEWRRNPGDPRQGWGNTIVFFSRFCLPSGPGCEADYMVGTPSETTPFGFYMKRPLNIDNNGFYSYSSGNPTKFRRQIIVQPQGDDVLKVSVTVFWQERRDEYGFTVEGYLYNWY